MDLERISATRGEILRCQEIRHDYPAGVFFYYHPNGSIQSRLKDTLHQALPHHLIIILSRVPLMFPADIGMQMGTHLNCYSANREILINSVTASLGVTEVEVDQVLDIRNPSIQKPRTKLEGGCMVPVGGTNDILLALPEPGDDTYLGSYGYRTLYTPLMDVGVKLIKQQRAKSSDEWLYIGHNDLLLTGFSDVRGLNALPCPKKTKYYMDSLLFSYLKERRLMDKPFVGTQPVQPLDHSLALQGGLNIKFIYKEKEYLALVPTIMALGPMAAQLQEFGWKIVELGSDQVDKGGGVKCRSLDLSWK